MSLSDSWWRFINLLYSLWGEKTEAHRRADQKPAPTQSSNHVSCFLVVCGWRCFCLHLSDILTVLIYALMSVLWMILYLVTLCSFSVDDWLIQIHKILPLLIMFIIYCMSGIALLMDPNINNKYQLCFLCNWQTGGNISWIQQFLWMLI